MDLFIKMCPSSLLSFFSFILTRCRCFAYFVMIIITIFLCFVHNVSFSLFSLSFFLPKSHRHNTWTWKWLWCTKIANILVWAQIIPYYFVIFSHIKLPLFWFKSVMLYKGNLHYAFHLCYLRFILWFFMHFKFIRWFCMCLYAWCEWNKGRFHFFTCPIRIERRYLHM